MYPFPWRDVISVFLIFCCKLLGRGSKKFHDSDPASEPSTRRRDGQVVLERRSEDGIQGQVEIPKAFFKNRRKFPNPVFFDSIRLDSIGWRFPSLPDPSR